MPFPLAHPAAVLPLKQACPRWLNFPALIVGSLSPDAAYLLTKLRFEELSHRAAGLVLFCLPAGLLLLAALYRLRQPFLSIVPHSFRGLFLREAWQPPGSLLTIFVSLLLGAATHVGWDSFTHSKGWTVEHWPVLDTTIATVFGRQIRICRLLWYASSYFGTGAVYLAYRRRQLNLQHLEGGPGERRRNGFLFAEAAAVAALVVPIELVHELVRSPLGAVLVAGLSLLLVSGVMWALQARAVGSAKVPPVR